jgi:predicted house-cleaning noncanonical NTP pyrophosphatase (MazG superfamily)
MEFIKDFLSFASPIASALFIWYIQYSCAKKDKIKEQNEKKKQEEVDKRAENRKQESLLSMRLLNSIGKLSNANSIALKDGKINGVMDDALVSYEKSSEEVKKFLEEQAMEHLL